MAIASPLRLRRCAGTLVVGAVAAVLAVPAASAGLISGLVGVNCTSGAAVRPFLPWNDSTKYELAPNGGFENGSSGWTLTGNAQVVSGNEPFFVNSRSDTHSLALPDGSSATSGPICIGGISKDMVRLFVSNAGSPSSRLHVEIVYHGLTGGVLGLFDGGYVSASGTWQPSPQMLALQLPLLGGAVQIRLTPVGSNGAWLVDDVYTDPWISN